jgi:hypothetical protein
MLEKEEEELRMSKEEGELPAGVEEEEEPPPTSPPTHLSHKREEEWCGGSWSFPPPAYMREEQVQYRSELPTSWREGGGAVRLEGEANLP